MGGYKEGRSAYAKNWRKNNPDYYARYKSKIRVTSKRAYTKLRQKLFDLLGDKCIRCGFTDRRALQVDHINGDANVDRARFGVSTSIKYTYYLKNKDEAKERLQILCANCNWIKRNENNENRKS